MYISNDFGNYLSHHGILGMHWGIRRYQPYGQGGYNPKKIIKSRRTMLRAMKKSHKEYYKSQGKPYAYGDRQKIGPNTERVYDEYLKKRSQLQSVKKSREVYQRLDRLYDRDPEAYEKELEKYESSNKHPTHADDTKQLVKEYVKKFNTATVKDLGFDDISTGLKYLKKYNLDMRPAEEGGMRFGRSIFYY